MNGQFVTQYMDRWTMKTAKQSRQTSNFVSDYSWPSVKGRTGYRWAESPGVFLSVCTFPPKISIEGIWPCAMVLSSNVSQTAGDASFKYHKSDTDRTRYQNSSDTCWHCFARWNGNGFYHLHERRMLPLKHWKVPNEWNSGENEN